MAHGMARVHKSLWLDRDLFEPPHGSQGSHGYFGRDVRGKERGEGREEGRKREGDACLVRAGGWMDGRMDVFFTLSEPFFVGMKMAMGMRGRPESRRMKRTRRRKKKNASAMGMQMADGCRKRCHSRTQQICARNGPLGKDSPVRGGLSVYPA